MKIKVGKHNYEITVTDIFMDNGSCVQLLSQSKERGEWGHIPHPMLPKGEIKNIEKYTRIQLDHDYSDSVQVFTLDL